VAGPLGSYAATPVADPAERLDDELTMLGRPVRGPVDHVETFPAPAGCTRVRFRTEEVTSLCPVTGQPDLYTVVIDYLPGPRCVESKSLKHYLWGFRDRPTFAEALAVEIATEIQRATGAVGVHVVATQHVRGGIVIETTSQLGAWS
jgi:7-cyano-7-deazaguanine reductase